MYGIPKRKTLHFHFPERRGVHKIKFLEGPGSLEAEGNHRTAGRLTSLLCYYLFRTCAIWVSAVYVQIVFHAY